MNLTCYFQTNLVSSGWSSLGKAFSAVNWPSAVGFEWNFTFLTAISANCLVHLSVSIHTLFQLLIYCCAKIASHTLNLTFAPTLINCMPRVVEKQLGKAEKQKRYSCYILVQLTISFSCASQEAKPAFSVSFSIPSLFEAAYAFLNLQLYLSCSQAYSIARLHCNNVATIYKQCYVIRWREQN